PGRAARRSRGRSRESKLPGRLPSVLPSPRNAFALVPKLRLGTPVRETPFPESVASPARVGRAKRSFAECVPKRRLGTRKPGRESLITVYGTIATSLSHRLAVAKIPFDLLRSARTRGP